MNTITFKELLTLVTNKNVDNLDHYESDAEDNLFYNRIGLDDSPFKTCEFLHDGGAVKFDSMYIRNNNEQLLNIDGVSHVSLFNDAREVFFDKNMTSTQIENMTFQIELK